MTYICGTHDAADLFHRVEIRAQTSMHGEDLLVNDGSNWQAIEAIGEGLPQLDVVSSLALVVEAVDSVDRGTFVVSSEDEEVLWVFDLVCQQKTDGFERLFASIYVVAEKKVVCFRGEAAVLKEPEEIIVLSMNITTDLGS